MGILEVEYSIREDFCHGILVASRCYDRFIRPSAYFEPREFRALESCFSFLSVSPLLLRNFYVIVEQRSRSFF